MDIPPQTPEAGVSLQAIPPQAAPVEAAAPALVPAGFWIRAGAYMIDGILITLGQLLIFGFLILVGIPKTVANLCSSLLGVGYFVWMPVANSGQTVGKMAAGIAVVRMDGSPLTYLRCLGRWAGYLVSTILAGLGFVIAAFTDRKRALHDYLADTRVVYVEQVGGARKALLVALALTPALLGVIAALAIPKFMQAAAAAGEESSRGRLTALRSAVAAYSRDNPGQFPADLATLMPKYLPVIDTLKLKDHQETNDTAAYDASACAGAAVDPGKLRDTGKWGYVTDPAASCRGALFVDCTHTDARQKQWASY
ncbi:MAG: RDD family protein [Elusimicrobia bacterium]|nr:RDD family protein [Elusimicrobiota bacterium]